MRSSYWLRRDAAGHSSKAVNTTPNAEQHAVLIGGDEPELVEAASEAGVDCIDISSLRNNHILALQLGKGLSCSLWVQPLLILFHTRRKGQVAKDSSSVRLFVSYLSQCS